MKTDNIEELSVVIPARSKKLLNSILNTRLRADLRNLVDSPRWIEKP
ncbi:MAG: hypothetical protein O2V44_09120 [Candidatus Bathyarchaeota archaeon]|nr:hypothetical protein [Candidatus Bathyarchaeota archaeon]